MSGSSAVSFCRCCNALGSSLSSSRPLPLYHASTQSNEEDGRTISASNEAARDVLESAADLEHSAEVLTLVLHEAAVVEQRSAQRAPVCSGGIAAVLQ